MQISGFDFTSIVSRVTQPIASVIFTKYSPGNNPSTTEKESCGIAKELSVDH